MMGYMTESINERLEIQKIKNGVLLRSPFYGSLLLGLKFVNDPHVKTAETDGVELRYNLDYVMSLPFDQRMGLFAHETDHCARNHHTRMGSRELKLYNIAADFSTNGELTKAGFGLPNGFLYDPKYDGMPVERIYNLLQAEREQQQQGDQGPQQPGEGKSQDGQGQPGKPGQIQVPGKPGQESLDVGGCGSVMPPKNQDGTDLSRLQIGKERAKWDSHVQLAESVAKRIGITAGTSKTRIKEMQEGTADWKDELREFMYNCVDQRYSWLVPDHRYDEYIPSRQSKRLQDVVIGIDTSSSVSSRQLAIVKAETNQMFLEVNPNRVHVIFWDTRVQTVKSYEEHDYPVDFSFPGRGGTAVQSFFRKVEEMDLNPACALIFTDMEIGDWGEEPEYPVLWGDLKARHNAPYGRQIDLSGV
jgi:predicted metal-dependent peptidase